MDQKILRHVWPDMWERRLWESEEKHLSLFSKAGDAKILERIRSLPQTIVVSYSGSWKVM